MAYTDLVATGQSYYPGLNIQYKNTSTLMKILGKILFFNPSFMTDYVTTIGKTIYLPSDQYVINNPTGFTDVFIHELTHMYDEKRFGLFYQLAYLLPQLLFLVTLPLIFLVSWKVFLPLTLLFLCPLPAPFRAYFEKRAYFVQMYVANILWQEVPLASDYTDYFTGSNYYFMWIFEGATSFTQEANNVLAGNPSCKAEPALFKQVSDLVAAAQKPTVLALDPTPSPTSETVAA